MIVSQLTLASPNRCSTAGKLLNSINHLRLGNTKELKNPGMDFAFSTIAEMPPAETIPVAITATREIIIIIPCIKSEALSAKNPLTKVYDITKEPPVSSLNDNLH